MVAGIWALIESIPPLINLWKSILASWVAYQKAKEDALITQAGKDQANAVTPDDKKKAAEETADAFRNL